MLKKTSLLLCALLLALQASTAAQDAMTVLNNASKAMGLDNVKTIKYTATGSTFSIGQSYQAGRPYPRNTIKKFVRDFDLENFMVRQEFVTVRAEERGGAQPIAVGAESTQVQYVNSTANWPAHVFMWLTPPGFIKGAMKNNPTLSTETVKGKRYNVVTVRLQNKYTVKGYFTEQNLMDKVETALDNHIVLGDAPLDGVFENYKDFNGVKFPAHVYHNMGLVLSFDFHITDFQANVPVDVQPPPPQAGRGGGPGGAAGGAPQQAGLPTQKIGEGVYYITGGTHYSVAVEFNDHIAVIDGPLNAARSEAVMAEVRKLIPNKPIRYLINTHHHFDHAHGIRAYAGEGATIVTYPGNRDFYEKWWAIPRSLVPDKLSQSGKKASFETVSDKKILTDGTQRLEIYVVKDNIHAEGMLMVYLPREKTLVEVDLYTPPAPNGEGPPQAYPLSLVRNIERNKLDVQQIIPLRGPGKPVQRAELFQAAGRTASTN